MGFLGTLYFLALVVFRANLSQISPLFFLGLTLIFIGIDLIYEWILISFDILPQTNEINSLMGVAVCISDTILDAFYVVQNGLSKGEYSRSLSHLRDSSTLDECRSPS